MHARTDTVTYFAFMCVASTKVTVKESLAIDPVLSKEILGSRYTATHRHRDTCVGR